MNYLEYPKCKYCCLALNQANSKKLWIDVAQIITKYLISNNRLENKQYSNKCIGYVLGAYCYIRFDYAIKKHYSLEHAEDSKDITE